MKKTPPDIENNIMNKIKTGQLKMRPKIYFLLGSLLTTAGLIGLTIGAIFLTNLTIFLLRTHGPGYRWRLEQMISSFPWWVPVLAVIGIIFGIFFLRRYDFSYKKNFLLIVFGFIISIVVAGWIIDYFGLNDIWMRRGPMRRFYQRLRLNGEIKRGRGNGFYRQNQRYLLK